MGKKYFSKYDIAKTDSRAFPECINANNTNILQYEKKHMRYFVTKLRSH